MMCCLFIILIFRILALENIGKNIDDCTQASHDPVMIKIRIKITYFTKKKCVRLKANNKGADQTAWMRRVVCAFVVRMPACNYFNEKI